MVFKFIALMFILHLVVSLPNNKTDAENKMDVKVDRNDVWKRKNGTRLPKGGASCNDIGGTCMSNIQIHKNKCKGKANTNFLCNSKKPNCCIERCPEKDDFFMMYNQCYKFIDKPSTWPEAKDLCEENGLVLAKPFETIDLRNYLVLRYGVKQPNLGFRVLVWLDAKSDGKCVRWNRGPSGCISPHLPLWFDGYHNVTQGNCLFLTSGAGQWKNKPDQTLATNSCNGFELYPLCELLM